MNINWAKIKYFFLDVFVWIVAHWQIAAAVAAFLVVLLIVAQIQSCSANRTEKKIEETRENVIEGKIISNVQANIVNQAANNSNQALANVNKAKAQNINSVSNDYNEARKRFCEPFPEDCR